VEFGINAVLKSLGLQKGDKIVAFSLNYGAVKLCLQQICQENGSELVLMELQFPLNEESLLISFENFIRSIEGRIRLAIFEHVTSPSAILLPIQKLASICHQNQILVLIDGAHGIGQLPLHLDDLGVDYYTTNGHKWLCNYRGCAILYCKESLQKTVHPGDFYLIN
jgi:isopenicillin-N epimerase